MSSENNENFSIEEIKPNANDTQSTKRQDNQWINELRIVLERGCDLGTIRNIGQCRPLTDDLRLQVWKTCLNIQEDNSDNEYIDNTAFDLREQTLIHNDAIRLIDSLNLNESEITSKINDIEAVITCYCKNTKETYDKRNGWIEILKPLLTLEYKDRSELYAFFSNIRNRYIPRDCEANGMPYHLFRLLLLYHDPELCSFFDTRKITPDAYAHIWIRSLYAGLCSLNVILPLWDNYFQHADQFFAFFLALVLLMFAKEQILEMANKERHEIIEFLSKAPSNLAVEDLEDFSSLASHYATNTPQSFRKEFYSCLFSESDCSFSQKAYSIYQALCLPVSVQELLQANQLGGTAGVRYFIVDCRPAEQYNSKHLYTAFHLDANLLLEDPKEFAGTVDALLTTQKQSIETGSQAGGEHLCFIGSGHDEEDKYVRMVVAYFLQRNTKYVSIASGGYEILVKAIEDPSMFTQSQQNSVTNEALSIGSALKHNIVEKLPTINTQTVSLINMISNVVKTKSSVVKDKVKDYIAHSSLIESSSIPRHVSKQDKVSKLYRQNQTSIFSLDDDDDEEKTSTRSQRETPTLVDIESWLLRSDILHKFECDHFDENDKTHPSLLLISSTHLYILRKLREHKTMANLVSSHPLGEISKITSKRNRPEILTFRYSIDGEREDEQDKSQKSPGKLNQENLSTDCDKVYLVDADNATKYIKELLSKD